MFFVWRRILATVAVVSMVLVGTIPVANADSGGASPFGVLPKVKADVLGSTLWHQQRAALAAKGYNILDHGIQVVPYQGNKNLAVVEIPAQIGTTNQAALDVFIVNTVGAYDTRDR